VGFPLLGASPQKPNGRSGGRCVHRRDDLCVFGLVGQLQGGRGVIRLLGLSVAKRISERITIFGPDNPYQGLSDGGERITPLHERITIFRPDNPLGELLLGGDLLANPCLIIHLRR
jgi:hypothetical protein